MSNIFYSQVDVNLQAELQERGKSAIRRNTQDLDFMLSKVANVQIVAFKSGSSNENEKVDSEYGILGGKNVREGRYLAGGKTGYLNETPYTLSNIEFNAAGQAEIKDTPFTDKTQRMPPYITSLDVTIGDHSMGLLNKSTIRITVPNPHRDLDGIEDVWMRPGRYMKLYIVHPESAILTRQTTNGTQTNALLSKLSIPNKNVLLELYPHWRDKLDEIETSIRKMNEYTFEGLITSFDLQYQPNGQVDVTISITGTSNVYTDVSMWMKSETKKEKDKQNSQIDPATGKPVVNIDAAVATDVDASYSFYKTLYDKVNGLILSYGPMNLGEDSGVMNFTGNSNPSTIEDRYIVFGNPFPSSEIPDVEIPPTAPGTGVIAPQFATNAMKQQELAKQQKQSRDSFIKADALYNRYITLGALIYFINEYVVSKLVTAVSNPMIMCDIEHSCSTYYKQLVSCIPDEILLLPKITDSPDGMNCYGGNSTKQTKNVLWYYKNIGATGIWPGVHTVSQAVDSNKIYASRILINLETIQRILNGADGNGGLTAGGKKSFQLKTFLSMISARIEYATGGAIKLKLMSHPLDATKMLFIDSKYLKTPLVGESQITNTAVTPFEVPMTIGSEYGSIVNEFNMTAKLPENAKNLAYVLNEGDVASEEDIAPFLNFMYNSKDPKSVNRAIATYKQKHQDFLNKLIETGELFAGAPYSKERQQSLYQALTKHIKFPSDDVFKAQQMIAPIFPFTVDFTIDGINGFRYGDVLEFKMLPLKYQINTVFSIIGITHTVSTNGLWTTNIKCIMRPAIK